MEFILTGLNTLQAMAGEQPLVFAVVVILIMVTEGLMLVGVINILLKVFSRPVFRAG